MSKRTVKATEASSQKNWWKPESVDEVLLSHQRGKMVPAEPPSFTDWSQSFGAKPANCGSEK
jgi:hypothetical protein